MPAFSLSLSSTRSKRMFRTRTSTVDRVVQAIRTLLQQQNSDGGIPAGNVGDESGPWTSSSTLRAAMSPLVLNQLDADRLNDLIEYLISSQQLDGTEVSGGWPMVTGPVSALATSDVLRGLSAAGGFYDRPDQDRAQLTAAIDASCAWLLANQDPNFGYWTANGPMGPHGGGSLFATASCIEALDLFGEKYSREVVRGAQFIKGLQHPESHGWGDPSTEIGARISPSVSNTARAIVALTNCRQATPSDDFIRAGLAYINRAPDTLRTEKVSLRYRNSPAEVVINNNTVCDVVVSLAVCDRRRSRRFAQSLIFLWNSFDHVQGTWHLSDRAHTEFITTWPTADWALAILAVAGSSEAKLYGSLTLARARLVAHRLRWVLILAAVLLIGILLRYPLFSLWTSIDATVRQFVLTGIVVTLVVGILAAALWDGVKSVWRRNINDRKGK